MISGEEPLDPMRLAVGVHDADVRVSTGGSVELRKFSQEVRQKNPVHPAVAHHEDRLAGALAGQSLDRAEGARQNLVERLPAGPRNEAVVIPPGHTGCLVEVLAGALADIDLAQRGHDLDGNAVPLRDRLRGVTGTREIAR